MDLVVVSCAVPPLFWEHRRHRAPLSKTAFRAARGTCPGTRRKQAGGAEPIWGRHVSALAANRSMTSERQANRLPAVVRYGSKAADHQRGFAAHIRFAPKADKQQIVSAGPLSAKLPESGSARLSRSAFNS